MVDKKILAGIALSILVIAIAIWYCWNEPMRLTNSGLEKIGQKDFNGAISDFDASIAFQPNLNPGYLKSAYLNRGVAKYRNGDLDGALSDLQQAVELAPDESNVYKIKGYVEYKNGKVEEGKQDIVKGLLMEWPIISPDDPSLEMNVQGIIENLDYSMNQ